MNNNLFVLHLIAMAFYVVNLNACTNSVKFKWKLILQMIEIFLPSIFVQFAFLFNYTKFWVNKMGIHIFKKACISQLIIWIYKKWTIYIRLFHDGADFRYNYTIWQMLAMHNKLARAIHLEIKLDFRLLINFIPLIKVRDQMKNKKMIAIRFILRQKFAN